jgi:formylglycine-generating enzyme
MNQWMKFGPLMLTIIVAFTACKSSKERSATTNWQYNSKDWGGFEKQKYKGQTTGPNLVLIEGGTFSMGTTEQDVMMDYDNIPRRVTVSSFYMDETEVANVDYREYLYWIERVYKGSYPEVFNKALPDTLVWREELAYNEPFVETYFRHPAYDEYPVVGVNWLQANEFCKWRTDRVNEMILIEQGVLKLDPEQTGQDNFNTESYLLGQYQGDVKKNLPDLKTGGERPVRFEDGIVLPAYRLPTEAEWEYAALALVGNQTYKKDERISDRRLYPWNGHGIRYQKRNKEQGQVLANIKLGRGDYMGMAGKLNDNAHITAPVRAFLANDYGLFNMAGNVNEWTMDVYRPLTSSTLSDVQGQDLNSFRGNVYQQKFKNSSGEFERDSLGRIKYVNVEDKDVATRQNYQKCNVINFLDGDEQSEVLYNYGVTSLVSDKARVIKGGSWADRVFWASPGARRFMDEDKSTRSIGFRCAMTRVGSPAGNKFKGGNGFSKKPKKQKRKFGKK